LPGVLVFRWWLHLIEAYPAFPYGVEDSFSACVNPHLNKDVGEMGLNCPHADTELLGDILVAAPSGYQLEYFHLTVLQQQNFACFLAALYLFQNPAQPFPIYRLVVNNQNSDFSHV
jgi:hypothetical protein